MNAETIANDAIGLFLEYRDQHGYPEPDARSRAVGEVAEGAASRESVGAGLDEVLVALDELASVNAHGDVSRIEVMRLTGSVRDVLARVWHREPVGESPGQGGVTEPVGANLCGAVMATCRNEPDHDGDHWHPLVAAARLPENRPQLFEMGDGQAEVDRVTQRPASPEDTPDD